MSHVTRHTSHATRYRLLRRTTWAVFLALILAFSNVVAFAAGATPGAENEVVVYVKDATTYEDCRAATIVVVPEGKLATVRGYAKSLVDDGKILYIQDTTKNKEELAKYFSIPKKSRSIYNDLEHAAATIYKANGLYVFSYIYVCVNSDDAIQKSTLSAKSVANIDDLLISARNLCDETLKDPTQQGAITRGLPSNSADYIFRDIVAVYNSNSVKVGEGLVSQYVYLKGDVTVNGKKQYVYDAVTSFKVSPTQSVHVVKYTGRMHCNITNHTMIDYTILPSNSSSSVGLSLSGGGVGGSTSWSFTPDSQTITTSAVPSSNYVDYVCVPQVWRYGQAWEAVPGIRVATTQPVGSRGVFSKITIPYDPLFGGKTYSVETGGWF